MAKKRKTNQNNPKKAKRAAPKKQATLPEINWKYAAWAMLALTGIIVFAARFNFLDIPMERDEGIYAYFGQLILDGKTPYVDFHENKFPALYYIYALLVGISGQTNSGLHFVFIFINIGTLVLIYNIGAMLFDRFAGVVSAVSFAILSMTMSISGFTTQSEHIVALFFALGLYFMLKSFKNNDVKFIILAGVMMCISFMTKSNGVFFIIFGGITVLLHYFFKEERDFKLLIKQTGLYSAGVFGIFGIACLVIAMQGAFDEMMYWTIKRSSTYIAAGNENFGMDRFWQTLGRISKDYMPFWISGGAALGLVFATKLALYKKIMLIFLAILSILTVFPGFRFYGHYWLQMIPGLAILVGVTFYSVKELLSGRVSDNLALGIPAGLFLLFVGMNFSTHNGYYFSPSHYGVLRSTYGMNPFPEAKKIADFLNTRGTKDDELTLFGTEPEVYFYTGRKTRTKHAYFSYLMNDQSRPEIQEALKEFKESVTESKPKHIVFFNHPISILARPNADMKLFDWMNKFLNENKYRRIGVVDVKSVNDVQYIFAPDERVANYKAEGERSMYIFEKP